jgi:muramoyltetrapeptide carboxypeptidase
VKPTRLRPGDVIGVVAPSAPGPARFPHRLERGVAFLESQGYNVTVAPHVYGQYGHVSGTPEERAEDIIEMFRAQEVRAIIAAIGGDHSCHLLPLLDWAVIRQNPKVFMGFSDVTVLNLAIHHETGLITFNGPMIMSDLGEFPKPPGYTVDHMARAIARPEPIGAIAPSTDWTEEFLDWGQKLDLTRPREFRASPGWTWLKEGRAHGPLAGGCFESLQHLRGTPFWPDLDGAILFLETSEEAPSPAWVDAALQDLENMGVFGRIAGLLYGRPLGYTAEQRDELRSVLLERTRRYSFPIVTDMDFGHTAPQMTLPIGAQAEVDTRERRFAVVEAAVI